MTTDLDSIYISSGVNEEGKGFCTVTAQAGRRIIGVGQLSPNEVRTMAKNWFEAAEAAESDAVVFRILREAGLPMEAIAGFLIDMRNQRKESNGEE